MTTSYSQRAASEIRTALDRLESLERQIADIRPALIAALAVLDVAPDNAMTPDAYTAEQVAHALGFSRSKVFEMLRRDAIRSHLIGGSRRVFRTDLEDYIASLRGEAA